MAVVNRKAGRAKPFQLSFPAEVLETESPGHATELTREAIKRGARTIIAVGGDGTINEVVNGFFVNEKMISSDVELSIVPRGTGSDFVRILNRAVPHGDRRMIDLMKVEYTAIDATPKFRYAVNVTSFGIGGEVAARVNLSTKPLGGRVAFFAAMAETAWSFQGHSVTLQLDNSKVVQGKITHVAVGNGQYQGAGMWVCPGAMIDDGLLDITVVRHLTFLELVKSLPALYGGSIYGHPKVESHRAKHVTAESKERVVVEIDGEPLGYLPARISILPQAIRVWVP